MSLQFIFGNSGSGKSHYLYEHIIEESIKHPEKNYLMLVPEQFTMETQKEFVMRHPRHGIMNIDVLSFERLAYRILEETGGADKVVLDDEGKNFVLRKVAAGKASFLRVLGSNIRKPGYISEVKSVISELAQYDVKADEMASMLETVSENSYLYYKLMDIQTLYKAFEEYLEEKFITREELLELLCSQMGKSRVLKNAVVAMDGFTGFTPIQNKVLEELLVCCEKVYVTVTMDLKEDPYQYEDKYQLFALSKQMVHALTKICEERKIEVGEVRLPSNPVYRFRENPALGWLESQIFRYPVRQYKEKQNCIRIYVSRSPKEEVDMAAQRIRSMVRKKGYRYQDIAVIVSDLNLYGDMVERIFPRYDIPVFMDYKRNVLLNSFVEYVRSLLAMIEKNFSYESVFRFLRSGFAGFEEDEVDVLENYVRALGIHGYKKWTEKWIRRTDSLTDENLAVVNRLREQMVRKLVPLVEVLKRKYKTIYDVTFALYQFLEQEELQRQVEEMRQQFQEAGELTLAKEYEQVYRVMIELFDKFVSLLGEERISLKEYCELLDAGMEEARIGVIPPSMDKVMIGDIERTRLRNVKALLLLGVNDNLISAGISRGGLLSERDREQLEAEGISLAPGIKEETFIQKYYLYLHLTKPTEELDISYSKVSREGKAVRPAYLIGELKKLFSHMTVFDMDAYGMTYRELVPETGLEYVIEGLRDQEGLQMQDGCWQELYRWYLEKEPWRDTLLRLQKASMYRKPEDALTRKTAEKLYGTWTPSISRMEKFVSCACAHFLTYGLRLKEREEYEFAALDFGNVIHRALEHYGDKVEKSGKKWGELDEAVREQYVDESVEESIVDYSNTVLYSSARNAYMIPRMKRMMRRTVWALTRQLQHGDFEPESYESRFGSGKIDRIDVCETEEEVLVKVVDYKTGSRKFDMTAFYHGLQLQLVVYMREALQLEEKKHPGKKAVPAGIFYYQMKDPVVAKEADMEKVEQAILKELKVDGLVNADDIVIQKLDREFAGSSDVIPVSRTKTGYSKQSKMISPEDFDALLTYADRKTTELQSRMENGESEARPYEMGQLTGCDFCEFHNICGFDDSIPGYQYRRFHKASSDQILDKIRKDIQVTTEHANGEAENEGEEEA